MFDRSLFRVALGLGVLAAIVGCKEKGKAPEKAPRPVRVETFSVRQSPTSSVVSAAVASWKTEEIGFEVGGRVDWVVEPNTYIEGRAEREATFTAISEISLEDLLVRIEQANEERKRAEENGEVTGEEVSYVKSNELIKRALADERKDQKKTPARGTVIAQLESERLRFKVESAAADVFRIAQQFRSVQIELDKGFPARETAALAEVELANTELKRSTMLAERKAGAGANVDRDKARLANAEATRDQLKAEWSAKEAELASLRAQFLQAQQSVRDAQRDFDDCALYSSFDGLIAETSVVPGSYVQPGSPFATVQLMNPIKIEVEVSAEESRRLRNRQVFPVDVPQSRSDEPLLGYLYLIDSVADSQTRTFTLTLLMENPRFNVLPENSQTPFTNHIWKVDFDFIPGATKGEFHAPNDSIYEDEEGSFLYRCVDYKHGQRLPRDQQVKVSKLRIEVGEKKLPFLGNWTFRNIKILPGQDFDPKTGLIAGQLLSGDGRPADLATQPDSEFEIMVDRGDQWMVRPGDLVTVNLSDNVPDTLIGDAAEPNAKNEYYVPMDAIAYGFPEASGEGDDSFLNKEQVAYMFLVVDDPDSANAAEESAGSPTRKVVKRIPIEIVDDNETSAFRRVRAAQTDQSLEGKSYVIDGVHYLRDGEAVKVSKAGGDNE